jgi:hypothetical protein
VQEQFQKAMMAHQFPSVVLSRSNELGDAASRNRPAEVIGRPAFGACPLRRRHVRRAKRRCELLAVAQINVVLLLLTCKEIEAGVILSKISGKIKSQRKVIRKFPPERD